MKIGLLFLFTLLILSINSCSDSPNEELLGEWKLVDIDYSRHMAVIDPELKESFQSMTDRQSLIILNKTYFDFRVEDEIIITSPKYQGGETEIRGKWSVSENGDSLYVQNDDSESFKFTLKDANTLILESGESPLRVLTLTKN